jgi:hypothetical protein
MLTIAPANTHRERYPILWDGHPARPCIIIRQDLY